jgi:DNA polymerase-4
MVGRRLREQGFSAHTIQLKLRYADFTTITRARSLTEPTGLDSEIFSIVRKLFHDNWTAGRAIRLLGVHASNFGEIAKQLELLHDDQHRKWTQALSASDRLRDKYGESAVFLAKGMRGTFRERVHENPVEKPERIRNQGPRPKSGR